MEAEIPQLLCVEDGGNQQDGIGTDSMGFQNLQGINDEILAQYG